MESFYIITNQLKDRDYSVTIEIKDYIERKGKRVILRRPAGCRPMQGLRPHRRMHL